MDTLLWIATGTIAGILARLVTRGRPIGFIGDAVLGTLGSILASWAMREITGPVSVSRMTNLAAACVGSIALVAVARLVREIVNRNPQVPTAPTINELITRLEARMQRISEVERAALALVVKRRVHLESADEGARQRVSFGNRVADRVASFGGSWTFLGCFAAFMLGWMFLNTETARPVDPYPFILLNLVLSCLAAVQAPVIMMSQNRQAAKDRDDAQQDYQVNLRAEMQITALQLKLDEARTVELQELVTLQREQLEILRRLETATRTMRPSE